MYIKKYFIRNIYVYIYMYLQQRRNCFHDFGKTKVACRSCYISYLCYYYSYASTLILIVSVTSMWSLVSIDRSVSHNSQIGRGVTLPCSYRSTCFILSKNYLFATKGRNCCWPKWKQLFIWKKKLAARLDFVFSTKKTHFPSYITNNMTNFFIQGEP